MIEFLHNGHLALKHFLCRRAGCPGTLLDDLDSECLAVFDANSATNTCESTLAELGTELILLEQAAAREVRASKMSVKIT
jgi:hypothetical protein